MEIGIGVPASVPGTTGAPLLEGERQAEAAGRLRAATCSPAGTRLRPGQVELLAQVAL